MTADADLTPERIEAACAAGEARVAAASPGPWKAVLAGASEWPWTLETPAGEEIAAEINERDAALAATAPTATLSLVATVRALRYAAFDCACTDAATDGGMSMKRDSQDWLAEGQCGCPCHVAAVALAQGVAALEVDE